MFNASTIENDLNKRVRSAGTGIHFCKDCNNMMTPKRPENREDPLKYYCKHCNYMEDATDNRVYVNVLKRTTEESFISQRLIADDPTLRRRRHKCDYCDRWTECVFFMAPTLAGESSMTQMLECSVCHHQWKEVYDE